MSCMALLTAIYLLKVIKVIRNAITNESCELISINLDLLSHTLGYPKDDLVENSAGYYAPVFLESLLIYIQPLVEETISRKLYPTYSYGRIYYKNNELKKHKDRGASEFGVSLCISKEMDWPLYFEESGVSVPYELNVGDLVIYEGMKYNHWRLPYQGNQHKQVFLMYVDANGIYSDWKWDKRDGIGCTSSNKNLDSLISSFSAGN